MFERFSARSIRTVMLSQKKARKLGLDCVQPELLLFGIVAEGTSAAANILEQAGLNLSLLESVLNKKYPVQDCSVVPEIQFSKSLEGALSRAAMRSEAVGSHVVEPEHILYELLIDGELNSFLIGSLFKPSGVILASLFKLLHQRSNDQESLQPDLAHLDMRFGIKQEIPIKDLPSTVPRTITDWFTDESIQVVSQAEVNARADNSAKITADHLLSALVPTCKWVPTQVMAGVSVNNARTTTAPPRLGKNSDAIIFSEEINTIFINARSEAAELGNSTIGPGHLLLGLLKSVADGTAQSALCQAATPDDLYRMTKVGFSDFLKTQVPIRVPAPVKPLVIDKSRVRTTVRFLATLTRALEFASLSEENTDALPHLVRAIIESARSSEVTFVQNHVTSLIEVEQTIATGKGAGTSGTKPKKDTDQHKLLRAGFETIIRRAVDHAKRLESNRLDINHLGLALLDEESDTIDAVVAALGPNTTHQAVKRRLDWCLLHQRFQGGHQSEPGEELNLRKLDQLYPGG